MGRGVPQGAFVLFGVSLAAGPGITVARGPGLARLEENEASCSSLSGTPWSVLTNMGDENDQVS